MNDHRYILTVQNSNIFKEIDIVPDVPVVKIGTLQECGVRIKSELFNVPVCVTVRLDGDDWRVCCPDGLYISSRAVKNCSEAAINHGDILDIHNSADGETLFTLSMSYDFTVGAVNFDTIIDIRGASNIIIGGHPNANIRLASEFVGTEYLEISRSQNGRLFVNASNAPDSATLNGERFINEKNIEEYDFVGLADYSFYYKNKVLYTSSRDDMRIVGLPSQPLRDETPAFNYPLLNRSPRLLYNFNTDPIEILNPPSKPDKPKDNLVMQLSPALAMMAVTVITRSGMISGLSMGNPAFMIFSLSTMAVGIMTTIMSFVYNRKTYKKNLAEWKSDYENYIKEKRIEIESEQNDERKALIDMYPDSETVRDFVKTFSGRLFERSPKDADFLRIRAGLGSNPPIRKVTHRQEEHIKIENELMPIPDQLCKEYELVKNTPVELHLREVGSIGVVGSKDEQYDFFKTMLLDLCVEHSYEDVQVIVLIPKDDVKRYEWIKWLPHIKESSGGARGIVCDDESRDNVYEYIYATMTERVAMKAEDDKKAPTPYIVVFSLDEYGMKTHPLFKFAEGSNELGISFVFFKEYKENLPMFCGEIVELSKDGGTLRLCGDKQFERKFTREHIGDDSISFVSERLAPVYCEKIALSSRLTSNITLFELLNIISPENLDLQDLWKKSNVQKSMAAPLGVDVKGGKVYLDLHEKAHGPHGLVAGTTGSGKSEIMQSYILSAAVNFHPYEVAFVIIDFKGGGMANQFENLPHLVGKITDIDSHEIERSLMSIRAELEKRKRLFAEYSVNHIDQYIATFKAGIAKVPLPHLILIVDEFAELKAEQPEFMKELISTARVGRSLGIHLILATQKPAGQVNEQIWSNSRFKLCLKVATREDSTEVIRTPLAAEIREPGRAYLQVGNNELFTLFQSAYSGASAISDKNGNMREFSISEVSFTGKRTVVYERKAEHTSDGKKITQLKALVDYIEKYCKEHGIERLPSICMPPLPEIIDFEINETADNENLDMRIGIYDDPSNQVQPEVTVNPTDGNIAIVGAAQTGKSVLLQMFIREIAQKCSPKQVSIYILDFASKALKIYEKLNHVGGVLTDSDDERIKNFFKMILEEIDRRKEIFSQAGVGSFDAYLGVSGQKISLPRIIIMVDNLQVFKDAFQEYEEAMLGICREGLALGITVIATMKQTTGLSYKYLSNFSTRIAMNCTEVSEYSNIFDRCQLRPKNVQGRGLISIDKNIYEFQAYLPFDGIISESDGEKVRTEAKRTEQIKTFISEIGKKYGSEKAKPVPSIPQILLESYWDENALVFDKYVVPVGLTYSEIEPVTVDLAHVGTLGIYGREGFGKSNLVRILLNYIQSHIFDLSCEGYLIDSYDRQLSEFESCGFVEQYTVDCADFEDIVQHFADAAEERLDILKLGGKLDELPLLLCVVQNSQIFAAGTVSREVCEKFKKLSADAKKLKMCFIFADIDNNPEYSPPEMLRLARDFNLYFFLDDIANVRFLGSGKFSSSELRMFKKSLVLGEGYIYDMRSGVQKVKLQKEARSR